MLVIQRFDALTVHHLDYLELRNLAFEWAESFDTKDWERLRRCLAPSLRLDFSSLGMPNYENLTPNEFVAIHADAKVIGSKRLKTQHFIGAQKMERLSDGSVHVWNQVRVAHQLYVDEDLAVVANKGHAHGSTEHWYRKIEGVWKLEASKSNLNWTEYDLFGTLSPMEEVS